MSFLKIGQSRAEHSTLHSRCATSQSQCTTKGIVWLYLLGAIPIMSSSSLWVVSISTYMHISCNQ